MRNIVYLIFSVVLFVGTVVLFSYMNQSISVGLAESATNEEKATTIDKRDSISKSQATFLEQTTSERTLLSTFIAHDSDIVHIIETIEAAGRREKALVSIGSVVVSQIPEWKQHEVVKIELSAKGTFSSLGSFGSALEVFPVASHVQSISLEPQGKGLWFGTFVLSLVKEKAP